MTKVKSVEEYINNAPREIKERLIKLREIVKKVAPTAEEKISYSMPYYSLNGRLLYFAYFKNYIGLYIMPPIVEMFSKELKEYKTSKSVTIQFPNDKKLPLVLIKKMIKARVKLNKQKSKT